MAVVKQLFLKPGRYHVGGGEYRTLTADELREYVAGTKAVLAAGHGIPVLYAHAPRGSAEGAPQQFSGAGDDWDQRAEKVRNTAGWLTDLAIGSDGAVTSIMDVTDPVAAAKLRDGSIKFTSPELRDGWTDGQGQSFGRLFSHMALVHKPRVSDQGPIESVDSAEPVEALQFSLDDYEAAPVSKKPATKSAAKKPASKGNGKVKATQFADDDKPGDEDNGDDSSSAGDDSGESAAADSAPDMPQDTSEAAGKEQKLQAVLAHLRETAHVALPSDTDAENLVDRLLSALVALEEANKQEQAEESTDEAASDDAPGDGLQAEMPPMQFSCDDVTGGKVKNKLLARVIQANADSLRNKIGAVVSQGRMPMGMGKALLDRVNAVQFSDEGDEAGEMRLSDVIDLLVEHSPVGSFYNPEQFSAEETPADTNGDNPAIKHLKQSSPPDEKARNALADRIVHGRRK